MRSIDIRLLLAGGALLSILAGATTQVWADWSRQPTRLAASCSTDESHSDHTRDRLAANPRLVGGKPLRHLVDRACGT